MREPATSSTAGLALWLLFATTLAAWAVEGGGRKPSPAEALPACFGELREVPLDLVWASDVRWLDEREVAIAAHTVGVARLRLDRPKEPQSPEVADGGRRSAAGSPWSLAVSEKFLAVGSTMFALGWKKREAAGLQGEDYFEFIWDLDVHDNNLVVLGIRKTEDGKSYEEEGAFIWHALLGNSSLQELRPLAFSTDGDQARQIGSCAPLGVGAARFLDDGSFVVVPTTEPGVYLFRPDGRLARTWPSEEFGLDGGCKLTEEQDHRIGVDLEFRMHWINHRAVVDDILPLGEDRFGLLVRRHEEGTTRWRMVIADKHGQVGACKIALAVDNRWVHLHADRHGGRVVLLQLARFNPGLEPQQPMRPAIPPRLYIAPLTADALASPSETPPPKHAGESRVPDSNPQEAPPLQHPQRP